MAEATAGRMVYEAVQGPRPEAIVVHCSDPRFQRAFDGFIEKELGLAQGQFVPIVVGGGAGVIARPERLPKEFKFMKDRFELMLKQFSSIRRIVLINHEDCKYYGTLKDRVLGLLGERQPPRNDLTAVARVFETLLSAMRVSVELYYARFADPEHSKITFERVKV